MPVQDGSKRDVSGILLLDKPAGMTSNRALQRTKRLFRAAKAGHTGSLDPLATGMLPICLGAATKVAQFLLDAPKTYRVVCALGAATDTGDADGTIVARCAAAPPPIEGVREALMRFEGDIEQVPPMYSALKLGGRRLYELARRGVEVQRKARRVRIHSIRLEGYVWPELVFTVRCSKGTYVRSLVTDVAAAAGTLGHVTALRRLAVEPFDPERMHGLEELEARASQAEAQALDEWLLAPDAALAGWACVRLDAERARRLRHGQGVPTEATGAPGLVRVYGAAGEFLGIGERAADGDLRPRRML